MKKQTIVRLFIILTFCLFPALFMGMEEEGPRALQRNGIIFAEEAEYLSKIELFGEDLRALFEEKNFPGDFYSVRFLQPEPEIKERSVSFLRTRWTLEMGFDIKSLQDDFFPALNNLLSGYAQKTETFSISPEILRDGRHVFSFPELVDFLKHPEYQTASDSCWVFIFSSQELHSASFEVNAFLLSDKKSILENVLESSMHDPKALLRIGFYENEDEEPFREDLVYHQIHPDYRSYSAYEHVQKNRLGYEYISFDSINSRQIFHNFHEHYLVFPYIRATRFYNPQYLFSVFSNISPEEMNQITSIEPFIAEKPYFDEEPEEVPEEDEDIDVDMVDEEDIDDEDEEESQTPPQEVEL